MIKSTLCIAIMATVFGASTAYAQSFTYESTSTAPTVVGGVGLSGTDYRGAYWSGNSTAVNEDGSTNKNSFTCVSMAQPPNSNIFDMHIACDVSAPDGTFSGVMGCTIMSADGSETSCVGGLRGKTGAYKDRNGSLSQYAKGSKAKGTGQWFE